ncbi:MAG: hypothetical protein HYS19_03625 [Nitrosomonadales bacterium]|nr:hypothetical protein [Nitrosomonadales bacterium]
MDKTIRKNEICVIGLPRCDFVFSSTRTCFIAYGFKESPLEMSLLRKLLEGRGIQAVEAGGMLAPGQSAFCAKICSKIITAQFCIVILNNEESEGREIPNANVNMEYGLMLGFNKYVIPFQRSTQKLPFNVAGLDTIKYEDREFERLAADAIDQAIAATNQEAIHGVMPMDQLLGTFLLLRRAVFSSVSEQGEKALFEIGQHLGFNLLNDFTGMKYIYFGNFTTLRPEIVLWRIHMLEEFLADRASSLPIKAEVGAVSIAQLDLATRILNQVEIWILVTSDEDKRKISEELQTATISHTFELFSTSDVSTQLIHSGF